MMTEGFLCHQNTRKKMGLVVGDGGVELVKLERNRSGNELILK